MIKEKFRKIYNNKWSKRVLFSLLVILIFLSIHYNNKQKEKYINDLKGETIGLTRRIDGSGKYMYLKYYFYTNKRILSNTDPENYEGNPYMLIDKFYKVKYDLNNPQENYIILEKELKPDSITLVKAGFTWTKYYFYDGSVTGRYFQSSRWK